MSSRLAALVGSVRVRLTFAVSIIFAGALTLASFGLVRQVENALVNDVQVGVEMFGTPTNTDNATVRVTQVWVEVCLKAL